MHVGEHQIMNNNGFAKSIGKIKNQLRVYLESSMWTLCLHNHHPCIQQQLWRIVHRSWLMSNSSHGATLNMFGAHHVGVSTIVVPHRMWDCNLRSSCFLHVHSWVNQLLLLESDYYWGYIVSSVYINGGGSSFLVDFATSCASIVVVLLSELALSSLTI